MELPALTEGAAIVIVKMKRQKEAELPARERRSMKRRRRLWVKKWLLRRAQFGQYDKRKYFGRRKAAVVLRKVYVLLAVNTLPSRSSRFPYVSQLSGVSAGFLRKN